MNPLFSVLVPVYNCYEYLPQCLDSIINQEYGNFELIIIDDGSTDRSGIICDNYANQDKRVKVIHKKNGGLVSARQAGSNVAVGDYVVCVDGDDWIDSNYLRVFNSQITKYQPDMICCGYIKSMENEDASLPMPNRKGFYSRENIEKELLPILIQSSEAIYFRPTLWAKAIKREIYYCQQQMIDCIVNIGEDGACVIPCLYQSNSLVIVDECLYHYRVNQTSMTKNRKPFRWDGPQLIGEHIQRQINMNEFDFKEQLYRKICHELFTVITSHLFQSSSYRVLKGDIMKGIANPFYEEAITKANFSTMKAKFMHYCLKHKLIAIIWVYSKFKKF